MVPFEKPQSMAVKSPDRLCLHPDFAVPGRVTLEMLSTSVHLFVQRAISLGGSEHHVD